MTLMALYQGQHRSLRSIVQHRFEMAESRKEMDGRIVSRTQCGTNWNWHHRIFQVGQKRKIFKEFFKNYKDDFRQTLLSLIFNKKSL